MNVHITGRNMELTPEIKAYCERRFQKLRRLLGTDAEVDVILSSERSWHKAEVHVSARGSGFLVAQETDSPLDSLRQSFDAAEKKLRKDREKGRDRKRRSAREHPEAVLEAPEPPAEGERRVIRVRQVAAKPMTLEEAVGRLETDAKREALVYRVDGSGAWAVLFRRRDGHFGLAEPE